jgi:hypothetical protein
MRGRVKTEEGESEENREGEIEREIQRRSETDRQTDKCIWKERDRKK